MKFKTLSLLRVASAAFFFACVPALAQNPGTVTNHAFPIGKGPGQSGYGSLVCNGFAIGTGSGADPICRNILTTDLPIGTSGATIPLLNGNNLWSGTNTSSSSITAVTGRFEGNATPTAVTPGSTGVEIGNNATFNFIQTAVRPSFAYGSQDLQLFSGKGLVFNTGGANNRGGIDQNGQFSITTAPAGQYAGLTVTQPSPTGNTATANCTLNLVYCLDTVSIGQTTPESIAFPTITQPTSATTVSGNVLTFASVPAGVQVGMAVSDQTTNATMAQNTYVASKTATTVTLTQNVASSVASGHNILFVQAGYFINGPTIVHQYGGSNITGGRQSLYVYSLLNGATNWGNGNNQYVGAVFNSQAVTSDGGTGLVAGVSAKGGIFPLSTIAALNAGAVNFNELGNEFDVSARAGSSVVYKNGLSIVALADDAVRGSSYDAALSISSQSSSSIGWKNGILFSAANNGHAVGTDGCLICTQDSRAVTTGLDFSSYTITGNFLRGPAGNFTVTGAGNIGTAGSLAMLGSTSGSVTISAQPAAGAATLVWPTTTGTLASSAASPIILNAVTGVISCSACLTGNQTITLSGDVTGSGTTAITTTLATAQPAVHTWALAQTFTVAPVFTDASGTRTALGLGALATVTPGTGIATALATNVGSAGAPVILNGALGSPSSAGTLPAFTLGGTISGGGNQINNVIIGSTTPLAGNFTTLSTSTSETVPLVVGGAGAASTLTLESTSGAGTTDAIIGKTASQVERFRITTGGLFGIGPSTAAPDSILTVNLNTGTSIAAPLATALHLVSADTTNTEILFDTYAGAAFVVTRRADGTQASKSAVAAGAQLFTFGPQSWDGSASNTNATMDFFTSGAQTGSDHSGYIRFRTTPSASTTIAEAMRIQPSGGVSVGTTTDPGVGNITVNGVYKVGSAAGLTHTCTITATQTLIFTGGILTGGTC
jgi:fibronectin-binding autotransporter adhesin